MQVQNKDNLLNFYKTIKDEYQLTFEQVEEICRGNWLHTKRIIESKSFEPVRQKYLGLFEIQKRRAKYALSKTEKNFEENKITKDEYEQYSTNLKRFIDEH